MPENEYGIVFTKEARADLNEIFKYIANNLAAPNAADKLIGNLENSCMRLKLYPFSGAVPSDDILAKKGYRMLIVKNFIAFYLVEENLVRIMRVVYGKNDYQKLL